MNPIDFEGYYIDQSLENLKKSLYFNNTKVLRLENHQRVSGISRAKEKQSNEEAKGHVSIMVQ